MSSPDILVEVTELEKVYTIGLRRRRVTAVDGISFEVRRGEVFGIVGPNGAGKTSTIKILTGLSRQTAGCAKLFGRDVSEVDSRQSLGYLPEAPYFYEHLRVEELLHFYGSLHGMDPSTIRERSNQLIARVGLDHARGRQLRKFSKGMRQRAGLAQALINDPELVILDEPQSGLDPVGRKDVRDLIFELKQQGKTVILSSHILPDVEAVCDRVAVLHKGSLVEIGSMAELASKRTQAIDVIVEELDVSGTAGLPGLRMAQTRGGAVVLEFDPAHSVADIVAAIASRGGVVQSVTPRRENLEDIFLRDTYGADALAEEE